MLTLSKPISAGQAQVPSAFLRYRLQITRKLQAKPNLRMMP